MSLHKQGNTNFLGHHHTDEVREKIGAAQRGVPKSAETRERMRAAQKGHEVTEETRKKMRAAMIGHEVTEETREKLSKSLKGMKFWNNGQINVMSFECPPGFVPGRLKKK